MPQKDQGRSGGITLVMETSFSIINVRDWLTFSRHSDWSHCQTATAGAKMNQASLVEVTLSTKLNQARQKAEKQATHL